MHLKSLELTGFKSFAEAKIEFPSGVTAVVGPNGTGKSNVVDAVLWVLGEQSTKTLRSERMEDVIFNGTESRKPLGMAEVSLIMSGMGNQKLDGLPPLPNQLGEFHEVMITRRLYRNGDSEYLLNKIPCRLKDIRSLFLDTRAGTKGHTVIEQGRIEQILNASPQERRELIEETAGIVRYKKQKAEALRKLDSTQQNLLRVRDITSEVRRQLNSLERQARQARAYHTLHQEARTLEIRLLVREYRALVGRQAAVDAELAALEAQAVGRVTEQARLSADLEAVRLRMAVGETAAGRIRDDLARVEHEQAQALTAVEVERGRLGLYEQQQVQGQEELARLGQDRERTTSDMAELRTRLTEADADIETGGRSLSELEEAAQALALRRSAAADEVEQARRALLALTIQVTSGENSLADLERRRDEVQRRAERLAGEQAELDAQRVAASERLEGLVRNRQEGERQIQRLQRERTGLAQDVQRLEERLRGTEQGIGRQQEDLAAVESRLQALQGVVREEMGYGRVGEEESTSLRAACDGVRAAIAEWLVVPPGFERAVEAALGERVRAWLVDGPAQARPGIEFLKTKGLGRGAFVPLRPRGPTGSSSRTGARDAAWWDALRGQQGVVGRAVDLVRASGDSQEALASLFDGVVYVETLDAAIRLWEHGLWSAPEGPTLVTLEGEVLDAAGVLTGGAAGASGGLLQRRREIERLEGERAELAHAVEEQRQTRLQLSDECDSARTAAERLDEAIREAEMRVLAFAKDEAGVEQSLEDLGRRLDTIRAERLGDQEERVRIEGEMEAGRERLARESAERTAQEEGLQAVTAGLQGMEEEGLAVQHRTTDARLAVVAIRGRREHAEADLARLAQEQAERDERARALERRLAELVAATRQSQGERDRHEALFGELEQRAVRIRAELLSAQETHARDTEAARQTEKELEAVRGVLTAGREARTVVEVQRAEIKTQLMALEGSLTGTYQLSVADALAQEPDAAQQVEMKVKAEAEPVEGEAVDPAQALREQLQKIRERLDRMGPINLAAIEEHRELEERHCFLSAQEADLSGSIASLKEIIARINRTTKQMFTDTFNELQQKFGDVFARLFPGGRAELVLTEPEEGLNGEPGGSGEPGVDIVAQPPGKRLKSITMLSGGEKTLTAMALIFASFLIRPTPFCVLDEIDAPLDEENIGRFTAVLTELAQRAQFIVITHNKRTMSVADSLFGVTMEEPGVSKLVSVHLTELQPA